MPEAGRNLRIEGEDSPWIEDSSGRADLEAMNFLIILERQLRQLARRPFVYRVRGGTGLAAALIGLGLIAAGISAGRDPSQLGAMVFRYMTLMAFAVSLFSGLILTADCLSEEKRNGTLGLLFLTNLRGHQIVLGKLIALMFPAIQSLLAIFPILALSFVVGGVTPGEFFRVILVLGSSLIFSLSAGMLVSALCKDGHKALLFSALLIFGFALGLPAAGHWKPIAGGIFGKVVSLTGSTATLDLASSGKFQIAPASFWYSLVLHQVAWAACLFLAGYCLPYNWQDKPSGAKRKFFAAEHLQAWWRKRRHSLSAHLLQENPILWLARRNCKNNGLIWVFLGISLGAWFWGTRTGGGWLAANIVFLVVYLLHCALKIWVAWESSRRFADDRNCGALELLLCTPMNEQDVWRGWLLHMKKRFLMPMVVLLFVDLAMIHSGVGGGKWWGGSTTWGVALIAGMGLFVLDVYTLTWVGIWQGLTARTSTIACINTIVHILVIPATVSLGMMGMLGLLAGATGTAPFGLMVALWFGVSCVADFIFCARTMTKLEKEFRNVSFYGLRPEEKRSESLAKMNAPSGAITVTSA